MTSVSRSIHTIIFGITIFLGLSTSISTYSSEIISQKKFHSETLGLPGEIITSDTADFNGDRFRDIYAIFLTGDYPNRKRHLALFLYQPSLHSFPSQPDFILDIPENTMLFDLIDSSSDPESNTTATLLFLDPEKIDFWQYQDANSPLTHHQPTNGSIFFNAEEGDLPRFKLIHSFKAGTSSKKILILPAYDGMRVFEVLNNQSLSPRLITLKIPYRSYIHTKSMSSEQSGSFGARVMYYTPEPIMTDLNNDKRSDLLFLWEDQLWVFYQQTSPPYFHEHPDLHFYLGAITENERRLGTASLVSTLSDLDQDGMTDWILSKYEGTALERTMSTNVYWGAKLSEGLTMASPLFPKKTPAAHVHFVDLFADSTLEALTVNFDTGIFSLASAYLSKKIDLNFNFFKFDPKIKRFQEHGDRVELSFAIDKKTFMTECFTPKLTGDFNGDGKPDAILGKDDHHIQIHFQRDNLSFKEKPDIRLEHPCSQNVVITDFDGDNHSEFMMYYRKDSKRLNLISVFLYK